MNPSIETDDKGNPVVKFFSSDIASKFRIEVQGMICDGAPGVAVNTFSVQ